MKILFFIDSLRSGGKERRLTELIKGLKRKSDIEVELIVMSQEVHYKELFDEKIKIHYLLRKSKKDLSVFFQLNKICKEFKPDILHCWDSMTAVYSVPICLLRNIKLINGMIVNAPEKINWYDKFAIRSILTFPFSDIILANSQAGLNAYNPPMHKSYFIHNGYDFSRSNTIIPQEKMRSQLGISTKYIVGMVASFSDQKDYNSFFKVVRKILEQRNDVTFLAVGSNTDSDEAITLLNLKNHNHVKLLGKRSDVESLINIMDVCVLMTFTEGISNSIMEYMALGKPTIATIGGGTIEIIKNNETGYLARRGDVSVVVEKINLLLNSDILRQEMGFKAMEWVKNKLSIDKMIEQTTKLYKDQIIGFKNNSYNEPDFTRIFIVGAQRSGTTLLRIILNSNSQLAVPEEGGFLMPFLSSGNINKVYSGTKLSNVIKYLKKNQQYKLWNYNTEEVYSELENTEKINARRLIDLIYKSYAKSEGKIKWGDKTPSFFRKIVSLNKLFPNSKYIHIVRDGRDSYLSWRKIDPNILNVAVKAVEWRYKMKILNRDLVRYAPGNYLIVRYEDLISNPEVEIKKMCDFCNLEYEPSMLEFYLKSNQYIGTHHSELIFKPIDNLNQNKWKISLNSTEQAVFKIVAGKTLKQFKYDVTSTRIRLFDYLLTINMLVIGLPRRLLEVISISIMYKNALNKGKALSNIQTGDVSKKGNNAR